MQPVQSDVKQCRHGILPNRFFRDSRRAAAVAVMAAVFLASPSAMALSSSEIKDRIEAAFGLTPSDSAELRLPLSVKASMRRAFARESGMAALAYGPASGEALAPPLAALESLAAGAPAVVEIARLPRPRPAVDQIFTGSIAPSAAVAESALLSEQEFFGRFAGSFEGSGEVQRKANTSPNQVTCALTGQPSGNRITISGRCGAAIFSREISADIRFDPATGRYTGTYVGAKVGPARLSGVRQGDAVVLTITWPKPVNGDTKATMTIRNSGNRQLAITVTDEFQPGGPKAEVTKLALNQI